MTISKAFTTARLVNVGVLATVVVKNEGLNISENITSLDFSGGAVNAVSDSNGNVVVAIDASASSTSVDGGFF